MPERRLRYSERKRLAETGSLGDLGAEPSASLRRAMVHLFDRAAEHKWYTLRDGFRARTQNICEEHFGWPHNVAVAGFPMGASTEDLLDYVEILVDVGQQTLRYSYGSELRTGQAWPDAEDDYNQLFDRHRFAFRLQGGEAHQIGSPALDETVVGPALLAVRRPGWDEVERSYREALLHQRGGPDENDDALTAANAALEAALKATGLSGKTMGELAAAYKKANAGPGQLQGVPEALDRLLKTSAALRNTMGDAHGKPSQAAPVPQAVVDLTIHLVGAFIVYLAAPDAH